MEDTMSLYERRRGGVDGGGWAENDAVRCRVCGNEGVDIGFSIPDTTVRHPISEAVCLQNLRQDQER